jgi:transposase
MDAQPSSTEAVDCRGCRGRDERIVELQRHITLLESRIKQLEQRVEELSRSGKRQAAPFSRGLPKADPKPPGRKSGDDYGTKAFRAAPPRIDEVHEAPLPARCPACGGRQFIDERVEAQYQVEIPRRPIYRRFNVAGAKIKVTAKLKVTRTISPPV